MKYGFSPVCKVVPVVETATDKHTINALLAEIREYSVELLNNSLTISSQLCYSDKALANEPAKDSSTVPQMLMSILSDLKLCREELYNVINQIG